MTIKCKGIFRTELRVLADDRALAGKSKLLWVGQAPIPDNVRQAARQIGDLMPYSPGESLHDQLNGTAVAVVCPDGQDEGHLGRVLDQLADSGTVGLLLLPAGSASVRRMASQHRGQCICADEDSDPEVRARYQMRAAFDTSFPRTVSRPMAVTGIRTGVRLARWWTPPCPIR